MDGGEAGSEEQDTLGPAAARAAELLKNDFITPRLLSGIWRAVEFIILFLAGCLTFSLYVGFDSTFRTSYLITSALAALVGVLTFDLVHGYDLQFLKDPGRRLWRIVGGWGAVVVLTAAALFFIFNDSVFSRLWFVLWFIGGSLAIASARFLLRVNILRWARNGRMERRAVLVGGGQNAEGLIRSLEMERDSDIRICGIFDDRDDDRSPPIVAGYPKLGNIGELVAFARRVRIDMLIVTLPLSAEQRVLALLKQLWILPIDIRLSAQTAHLRFRPRTYSYIGSVPMIDVIDQPLADWDHVGKRIFDIVFGTMALILLSPVFLVTALAVKLDSKGPIFFRQKRHGFNNQIVQIFKFRSLFHEMSDPAASKIVTRGDKRVTRVGRFIRRTSIDELPQLFNVILGSLSLVGPRPHAVHAISSENQTFVDIVDGYFGRHRVKPGITGWAHIHGWRGEIDQSDKLRRRFEHDLYYIENWSILLDLYILVMTPVSLLRSGGAAY